MLKQNTIFVGNVVKHHIELASTNDLAIDLLAKTNPIEGFVISTGYQHAGRGQIGRSWYSKAGLNVLISIILRPKWLLVTNQFQLSQAIALGIADTVKVFTTCETTVKWPNDIYVGCKKIAGILIQNSIIANQISWSVIGIGLNVNEAIFPDELPNATSLKILTAKHIDLEEFKSKLFQYIEYRYLQLKSNPSIILRDYLQHLYQYQSWATYQDMQTGQIFEGQIIGVNKIGQLAVQRKEKPESIQYFGLKEIVFL